MARLVSFSFLLCSLIAIPFALVVTVPAEAATLTAVGPGFFSGIDVDYGLVQTLETVHSKVYGNVRHDFTINNIPSLDAVIDSGPGDTNNITVANIEGNALGVLHLTFYDGLQQAMGFGFALSDVGTYASAVSVELIGADNLPLGSLSGGAAPDPVFTGGFFGVHSDVAFARASIRFLVPNAARFAFDNLRFESATVPEPTSLALLATGLFAALTQVRRRER
jgi:hypothetical protein